MSAVDDSVDDSVDEVPLDAALVRQQAQGLLDELTEFSRARAQISRAAAIALTGMAAAVLLAYGLWSTAQDAAIGGWIAGLAAHPAHALSLGLGVANLVATLWLLRDGAMQSYTGRSLVLLNVPFYLTGLWYLGLTPMLLLPVLVVWAHILVPPREALWITLPLVAVSALASIVLLDPAAQDSASQLLVGSVLIALFLHLVALRIMRTHGVAESVTRDLQGLTERLGRDLRRTSVERDEARTIDPATGLLNAQGLQAVLAPMIKRDPQVRLCMVMVRLPGLRDSMAAAQAADQRHRWARLGGLLRSLAGPTAVLATSARLEFCLVLQDDSGDGGDAAALRREAVRWCSLLAQPLPADFGALLAQPVAGLAAYPGDAQDPAALMRCAEVALLSALQSRVPGPVVYEAGMSDMLVEREALTQSLQRAIEGEGLELNYQPIVSLQGESLRKAEALIRWQHPQRGRLSPADFIPLAEETGQVAALTEWVLAKVAGQVREWRAGLAPDIQISVNMPPAYLEVAARDPQEALRRLRALDLAHGGVVLEITEGALLRVDEPMLQLLHGLRSLGLQISLDDFGMGYSSFNQLDRLPLDFLKIDKAFVDEIQSSPRRRAICESVIRVGHALGLKVIAEGIQSDAQRDLLARAGCDYGQGYGFAAALPADALAQMVLANRSVR